MSIRRGDLLSLVLTLTVAVGVQAQTAAPAKSDGKADAKGDAKADAKDPKAEEAAAAMERAKRMAAGPMRVILEASKGKRREPEGVAATAPAAPADASSLRTVSTRTAAAPEISTRSAPAPQPAVSEPAPPPVTVAPAPTAAPVSTQITLTADGLNSRSVAPVPALESAGTAAPVPTLAPALPAALPKLADSLVKPRLVSRVDPELSQRLLDDLGRNAVIAVELNLRADGRVAGISYITAVTPRVQRALAVALEQWRFDPLPSDRNHRVELVFNSD